MKLSFKDFLNEEDRKTPIEFEDDQEIIKLLNEHCSQAMQNFDKPIWRGTNGLREDVYIIHGEAEGATSRKSKNTSNYYTMIMDKFLGYFGYPKRSRSIICGNYPNKSYADSFGTLYAIFPFDDVAIGVCQEFDLWYTPEFQVGKHPAKYSIEGWNRLYRNFGLSADSWEDFKETLEEKMERETEEGQKLMEWFGPEEKISDVFRKAYSPENLQLELTDPANVNNIPGKHELWISGKCIAIEYDSYRAMLQEMGNSK